MQDYKDAFEAAKFIATTQTNYDDKHNFMIYFLKYEVRYNDDH